MAVIVIIVGFSLSGSFLCSLMEAALYSIPETRVESLARRGHKGGKRLRKLRTRIDEPIAAILTFNTAVNTLGAAWAGALVGTIYGDAVLGVFSAGFTAAVLFISEIIPKSLGITFAHRLAPILALPIQLLIWIFYPFVKAGVTLTKLWGKDARLNLPTASDIVSLARLSKRGGAILSHEVRWIRNALRLDQLEAAQIMTPWAETVTIAEETQLAAIDVSSPIWRFSRVPVTAAKEGQGGVVGIVRRKDVFAALTANPGESTVAGLMVPAHHVDGAIQAHELLKQFVERREHLVIVNDSAGLAAGVVTLEDVLEELIGVEIEDEHDIPATG